MHYPSQPVEVASTYGEQMVLFCEVDKFSPRSARSQFEFEFELD